MNVHADLVDDSFDTEEIGLTGESWFNDTGKIPQWGEVNKDRKNPLLFLPKMRQP